MKSVRNRTLIVVAGVFRRDDSVLACRRAPNKSAAGRWEFPGGKVEQGESHEAALVRELSEELSTSVEVSLLLDRSTTPLPDISIDLSCYLVTAIDVDPVASSDHDLLKWVPVSELDTLEWAQPDLPAVAVLKRHILERHE